MFKGNQQESHAHTFFPFPPTRNHTLLLQFCHKVLRTKLVSHLGAPSVLQAHLRFGSAVGQLASEHSHCHVASVLRCGILVQKLIDSECV